MTLSEFSDQFDVLYNNIMSNAAPGLNEYEKSVFLTKAQYEIVKNYFNPQGNKYKEGYDGSAKRQMDFSKLMKQVECDESIEASSGNFEAYDPRAVQFVLPDDVFIPVNESVVLKSASSSSVVGIRQVIPVSYDEYSRLMSKPYKEPLKNQAWRLITGQDTIMDSPVTELILNYNDSDFAKVTPSYRMRYVKKPQPIITVNLSSVVGDVRIEGLIGPSDCELDPSIHSEILQRAVELAKAAYASDQSGQAQLQNQITVGQRSE